MQHEKRVGEYRLINQIARSQQALLFLSQSPTTDKPIAVKLYPKKLADTDGFMRQFFTELSYIQQLNHPNILPIHHYELAEKFPAIEMPYMAGGNLEMRIQNDINLVTLKDSVSQIFQALIHAQRQGSIHGNIKPTNILFDDEGNAYLSDFYLKSVAQHHPVANTTLYSSPEHIHGEKLDDRSDVFSFGMVLFSWMTGEYPLSAPLNSTEANYEPPSVIHYLPNISLAMSDVIAKATQYQPSDRYGSIKEFAEAFFRALRTDKIFLQMLEDVRSDITEFAPKTILNAHSKRVMGFEEALSQSIFTDEGYYIRSKKDVQPKRRSKSHDAFLAISGTLTFAFVGFLVFLFVASLLANNPSPPYEPALNPPGYVVYTGRDVEISAPNQWKPVQQNAADILAGFFEGASVDLGILSDIMDVGLVNPQVFVYDPRRGTNVSMFIIPWGNTSLRVEQEDMLSRMQEYGFYNLQSDIFLFPAGEALWIGSLYNIRSIPIRSYLYIFLYNRRMYFVHFVGFESDTSRFVGMMETFRIKS